MYHNICCRKPLLQMIILIQVYQCEVGTHVRDWNQSMLRKKRGNKGLLPFMWSWPPAGGVWHRETLILTMSSDSWPYIGHLECLNILLMVRSSFLHLHLGLWRLVWYLHSYVELISYILVIIKYIFSISPGYKVLILKYRRFIQQGKMELLTKA